MSVPSPSDRRPIIAAWCLYDWANSAFNSLVVTFVYSTFFSQAFGSDPGRGTALWSRGITISAIVVALLAPLAGALADHGDHDHAFFGPLILGILSDAYSQRVGVFSVLLFFVVRGLLLLRVDEAEGIQQSERAYDTMLS